MHELVPHEPLQQSCLHTFLPSVYMQEQFLQVTKEAPFYLCY